MAEGRFSLLMEEKTWYEHVTKSSPPFDSILARVEKFIMTRRNPSLGNSMYDSKIPLEYTQLG